MTAPGMDLGSQPSACEHAARGVLILNADDWGRDRDTTDRIVECVRHGTVSATSGMVFMADSARSAGLAGERGIDVGLHLNLTTAFSAPATPTAVAAHQERLSRYLRRHRLAPALFHPGLARSFDYVVRAQLAEYERLYGVPPSRIDGHHHMHLCANVLWRNLLPKGTVVRRNFSFRRGEKSALNRCYRAAIDRLLRQRHILADYLFVLPPMDVPGRLRRIFALARSSAVEVETHPINPDEYRFLTGGAIVREADAISIAPRFTVGLSHVR